jgi:uracil-DNA glycosylase
MHKLLEEIRACMVCKSMLPYPPRPIVQAGARASILLIGQAPGTRVQASGIPWDDASGNELRRWLGVSKEQFYNPDVFALVPMGFCYPGKGNSGDLPPRPECAPLWHAPLRSHLKEIKLTILIGHYAQKYYLKERCSATLTENVQRFRDFIPEYLPLVHPSPRNNIWQKKNPWFEAELIPELREQVRMIVMGMMWR